MVYSCRVHDCILGVVGLGKLGLPLAATFGNAGHHVIAVDIDKELINKLNQRVFDFIEPNLNNYLELSSSRVMFTSDFTRIEQAEIVYLIVPTPSDADGFFLNDYLISAISKIGRVWAATEKLRTLVIVSTVMPGSTRNILIPCLEQSSGKKIGSDLQILYSPEFIAVGSVINDLHFPDLLLIGGTDGKSIEMHVSIMKSINLSNPIVRILNLEEAELVKILINNYITMKITFANHVAELTDLIPGTNPAIIAEAIGNDSRIGNKYLRPGLGFGGPCFPRDTRALKAFAGQFGLSSDISHSVELMNMRQPHAAAKRIVELYPEVVSVGIYGLAYKAGSVLIEESQAIMLATILVNRGLKVSAYDPLIRLSSEIALSGLEYSSNIEDLKTVGLLICTQPVLPEDEAILQSISKLFLF
jgi:UDPglucose 6-dehydrogenase